MTLLHEICGKKWDLNYNEMKKQTAVQWLIENVIISAPLNWDTTIVEQALEMEKEQMKSSYEDGKRDAYRQDDVPTAEEYIYQKYKL